MERSIDFAIVSIAMQMILVPIFLTAFLIGALPIWNNLTFNLGSDASSLVNSVFIIIGSLVTGGLTALFYLKLSKRKTKNHGLGFYIPLIPIFFAFAFAVVIYIMSKGNFNSELWAIYIFKNPMFFFADIILSLSGFSFLIPITELIGYLGYALVFYLVVGVFKIEAPKKLMNKNSIIFTVLCIGILVFISISAKDVINYGYIELRYGESNIGNELTEYDLSQIAPFEESNGLARLEKAASLQFEKLEDMPRLDGATAAYPVYASFVQSTYKGLGDYYRENKDNPDKQIYKYDAFINSDKYPLNIVRCSKTNIAYKNLIEGNTDVIFTAEPSKAQIEAIKAKGDDFVLTPIGYEAFVFFTNTKNPVQSLTINQIQDIYSGKITNWSKVGGKSSKIVPFQRPEDSGSQTIMQNKVMKDIKMMEPTMITEAGGMGEMISKVADYKNARNAIGYSFMYYSSTMVKNNQIKYIGINGVSPTPETVRSKSYPFTVPVYAVTLKSNRNENISRLINWILSEEGQSLIEKTGYIPIK